MNVRANKTGVAFGKFAEIDNLVDFGWPIRAFGTFSPVSAGFVRDFNTVYTPGVYSFNTDSSNGPPCEYGLLLVYVANSNYSTPIHNNSSNWLYQIAFSTANNDIFVRQKINANGFTGWIKLLNSSNYSAYTLAYKEYANSVYGWDASGTKGAGLLLQDEYTGTRWSLHTHSDAVRIWNGSTEKVLLDSSNYNNYALKRYSPNGYEPIRYFAGDKNGDNMVIGLGGSIVIGSGESAQTCISQSSWGTSNQANESLDLTSDSYVNIHTNLQNGFSNKKMFSFRADGRLVGALYGCSYTEGNGVTLFTDCDTYMEIRSNHGAKGLTWWDSDASLKDNIKNTEVRYALEKIAQLNHVEFDWKESGDHVDLGYVADDVEKVLPCLVFEVPQYDKNNEPDGSIKNIDHRTLIPLITMGMQELIEERDLLWSFDEEAANCIIQLREEVEELKQKTEFLETELTNLKAELEALKQSLAK
jgi:hypothetical protein